MTSTAQRLAPLMRVPALAGRIHAIRGMRVMLGPDLAELYGVSSKALMQGVRRNRSRFPADFAFRITVAERKNLRSQIVTSSWGGSRYLPFAFTEQGVAMLSSILQSSRAVKVNIAIMRAFVRVRAAADLHAELVRRIDALEVRYDGNFEELYAAIRRLIAAPSQEPPRPRIGFHAITARRPRA